MADSSHSLRRCPKKSGQINLGIRAGMLGRWKREMEKQRAGHSSGDGGTQVLEAELKQLRRENEQLRMEREILKKAAAFFAKESE